MRDTSGAAKQYETSNSLPSLRGKYKRRFTWSSRAILLKTEERSEWVHAWHYYVATKGGRLDGSVKRTPLDPSAPASSLPANLQIEHVIDVSD